MGSDRRFFSCSACTRRLWKERNGEDARKLFGSGLWEVGAAELKNDHRQNCNIDGGVLRMICYCPTLKAFDLRIPNKIRKKASHLKMIKDTRVDPCTSYAFAGTEFNMLSEGYCKTHLGVHRAKASAFPNLHPKPTRKLPC